MNKWLPGFAIALAILGTGEMLAHQESAITFKVLYDNYTAEKVLAADWGFSCLITGTEKSILFDTGAKGDVLLQNMAKMGISPDAAEVAVISHNHGDHTGGLISVLDKNRKMTIYLPPSCPEPLVRQAESLGAKVITVTKPVEICRGVFVIGPTDDKIVEQALAVDTVKGLVLITGCSHPGVIEIAKRAKKNLGRDVYMVCGGMHLLQMSDGKIGEVVRELKSLGIQKIGPTHCTGDKAIGLFKESFGGGFVQMGAGRVLRFGNVKNYTNPVGDIRSSKAASSTIVRLQEAANKGRAFLAGLFDPSVDLLPEYRGSKTYWLYHDNYLAAKVLQKSHSSLAAKIVKSVGSHGVRESGKIEILFGEARKPLPFRHYKLAEVRRIDDKLIKIEVVTDQVMTGWEEYADLLLLAAIVRATTDPRKAREHVQSALQMWDGIGFNDRAVRKQNCYATYKLALALFATAKLGERPPAHKAILERLLAQQSKDGGWITDYDLNGRPVGLANVETTSLAVLTLDTLGKR